MRRLPGLHKSSEAPASLSPSSTSTLPSPSIEVNAVTPDAQHAHALWLSSSIAESSSAESSSAESCSGSESGAEKRETSGGEASILQILKSATATDMEASVPTPAAVDPSRQPAVLRRGAFEAVLTKRLARLAATRAAEAEDNSYVHRSPQPAGGWDSQPAKPRPCFRPCNDGTDSSQTSQAFSGEGGRPRWDKRPLINPPGAVSGLRPVTQERWVEVQEEGNKIKLSFGHEDEYEYSDGYQTAPVRQTERSTQQGCSAASSLSPSSLLESIGDDDSRVQPSHQTSPVRHTERGTAVAAIQFLELLRALDPSTGNLTTAQLTKGATPRAARAKTEHLRIWTPARPEAIPAPEAAPAEPAPPAKQEPKRDPPLRVSAEPHSAHVAEMDTHSAHTTEMLLLYHMRQADNVRHRTTSGELRATWNSPAWSRGAGRSRAKTHDSLRFEGFSY
jgi:hypothetical protein